MVLIAAATLTSQILAVRKGKFSRTVWLGEDLVVVVVGEKAVECVAGWGDEIETMSERIGNRTMTLDTCRGAAQIVLEKKN